MRNLLRPLVLLASLVALVTCAEPVPTDTVTLASIQLTPSITSARAGSTVTLDVKLTDIAGKAVEKRGVFWSSSNGAVASVSSTGVVTTKLPGQATIAASAFGKSATATITVTAREVASVQVSPTSISVRVGFTAPLQADPLDAEGSPLSQRAIAWSSSAPSIATVNAQGVVSGVAVGSATITATCEGKSGSSAVTVSLNPVATVTVAPAQNTIAVGQEASLVATTRDANGATLTGRVIVWTSSNTSVATVSTNGVVTALSTGTVTVTATSEGHSGNANVNVLARLADAVTLTPSSSTIIAGTTVQLSAQVTDQGGNLLANKTVSYSSDNNAIATVNSTGLVTAVSPGTAHITGTSEGRSGTATITVIPVPVANVAVSPPAPNIIVGNTVQLSAVATSSTGALLQGRTVTWTSGAPSVATTTPSGLVTGIAQGIALILAVVDGVAGTSTVTVRLATIASVTVAPAQPVISIDGTVQLSSTLRDASGNILTNRTVTWSSANENIAFVTSTGLVIGVNNGSVAITATSEGVSGSTVVTVR